MSLHRSPNTTPVRLGLTTLMVGVNGTTKMEREDVARKNKMKSVARKIGRVGRRRDLVLVFQA